MISLKQKQKMNSWYLVVLTFTLLAISNASAQEFNYTTTDKDSTYVLTMVEEMPQIIGGISELYSALTYPPVALKRRIEGKVFVQFIVDTEGNVTDPKILKDIGFGLGEAAIQALTTIKFTPGIQNGIAVPVAFTLPVTFKLKE